MQVPWRIEPITAPAAADPAPAPVDPGEGGFAELLLKPGSGALAGDDWQAQLVAASTTSATLEIAPGLPRLTPQATRTLCRALRDAARRGEPRVELRLRPVELGGLCLSIALEGVRVHVRARLEDPRVARVLRESRDAIEEGLQRWGLQLGTFEVRTRAVEPEAEAEQEGRGGQAAEATSGARSRRSFIEVVV